MEITTSRKFAADDFIKWITSIPPSAEFAPLIQHLNPDFLFYREVLWGFGWEIEKFLIWLKVGLSLVVFVTSLIARCRKLNLCLKF
jgi:hypothetical protein